MNTEDILRKLVSFPVLGGMSNLTILKWIKEYIESQGVSTKLVPNDDGNKASLHCRIGPAVDGGVILSGHMDVVPVVGQPWETDPFILIDKGDGKLYGRGACDMKGFLACCLSVLPQMVKTDLKRPIYFALSYDEEIGCIAAPELARDILNTYDERPRYAIIGEPTMLEPVVGQKGIWVHEVNVNGSAGHSSRIRQEVSAIHEAARLVMWLENKMNILVGGGSSDERFDPPHSSIHIGVFKGGTAHNIVADGAMFQWDLRTIPKDNIHEIVEDFKVYCRAREKALRPIFPGFEIKSKEHHPAVPPLDTPADSGVVELIKKISGNKKLGAVSFAAEAGQFAEAGFESVICGPGSIAQAHRANEFIEKKQLEKGTKMILNLVHELKL